VLSKVYRKRTFLVRYSRLDFGLLRPSQLTWTKGLYGKEACMSEANKTLFLIPRSLYMEFREYFTKPYPPGKLWLPPAELRSCPARPVPGDESNLGPP
jgi:hypothetical protein